MINPENYISVVCEWMWRCGVKYPLQQGLGPGPGGPGGVVVVHKGLHSDLKDFLLCSCFSKSFGCYFYIWKMNIAPLQNKPYVNLVSLWKQNLSTKFCPSYNLEVCLKRSLDLSKEVLWVSVGQTAAKLWAIKVRGLKKILPLGQSGTPRERPGVDSRAKGSS